MTGCVLLLRNGDRLKCDGLSLSRAKHMRRSNSQMPFTREDGKKMLVMGSDIKNILAIPSQSQS